MENINQNKIILALDQASHDTGFALFENGKLIDYGVYRIVNGTLGERIEGMRHWLENKIAELKLRPDTNIKIVLEDIQMQQNVETYKALAHLQGVLINTLLRNKVDFSIYYASEWKSTCKITGRTRSEQKRNAQQLVMDMFGKKVIQDTCDAICLGLHELRQEKANEAINFE